MLRARSALALALLSLLAGGVGRAQGENPRAAAAARYAQGVELASRAEYQAALAEFEAAYALSPHFAVLYNIGQAQDRLNRPLEAISALTRYLRDGADQVPLSRREQVQAQIALLEAKVAELSVVTDRPGAVVRVDGNEIGRAPLPQPQRLTAGTHNVSVSAPDGARLTREVALGEGERQTLELSFGPLPPAPPPAPVVAPVVSPPPPAAEQPGPTLRRAPAILAGAGVVLGGAALGVYLWNRGRYQDWQAQNQELQSLTFGAADYRERALANNQLADDLTSANHAILGLSLAAGAVIAVSVTMFLINRAHGRQGWSALW